jgi:hypothetical protein
VVGPGAKIDLKTAAGKHVRSLESGVYLVVVSDKTATDNFHLTGSGINRKSKVEGKGTSRWKVRFGLGRYRYRSDAHPKLRGSFRVKPAVLTRR